MYRSFIEGECLLLIAKTMAIAGVVILYHPEETAITNIQSYLPYLDKLYIADNTEQKSEVALYFQNEIKVQVIHDGSNKGIATRLNEAADLAIKNEHNWLLTMDQDSFFEDHTMPDYLLCAGSYLHKDRTAMFGVTHEQKKEITDCTPVEKNKLITSGSIVNLRLFSAIGGFEERLFIDEVDHDYCYRARLKNYLVVQFQNIFLHHSLGVTSQHRSFKNSRLSNRSLHSPQRMYYMVRNFLYMNQKFKNYFPDDILELKKMLQNRIKNNLLYNRKRGAVFMNICKGFIDFKRNKF